MRLSKVFLTGCDYKTEWQLSWFIENYKKFNNTKLLVADFGMTPMTLRWLNEQEGINILQDDEIVNKGWFAKPAAMILAAHFSNSVCWIDTDCQVFGDISGVFDYIEENKLAMVEDKPWSARRGEKWHNSGVVAFEGVPKILSEWANQVALTPKVGDQEVLHEMVRDGLRRLIHITDLPNIYNWLRIQILDGQDNPNKLILHHTGGKGKDEIKKQMGLLWRE